MGTLKEETNELHKKAEQHPFNQRLMNGELSKEEYGRYLKNMEGIFSVLETQIEPLHPSMVRADKVRDDIQNLELMSMPMPTMTALTYTTYLKTLPEEEFLAHVYLHYLAIVFGGQMIKKNVPGDGTMYEFENQQEIVKLIREKQGQYEETWIPQVKKGYQYMIQMFDELENES